MYRSSGEGSGDDVRERAAMDEQPQPAPGIPAGLFEAYENISEHNSGSAVSEYDGSPSETSAEQRARLAHEEMVEEELARQGDYPEVADALTTLNSFVTHPQYNQDPNFNLIKPLADQLAYIVKISKTVQRQVHGSDKVFREMKPYLDDVTAAFNHERSQHRIADQCKQWKQDAEGSYAAFGTSSPEREYCIPPNCKSTLPDVPYDSNLWCSDDEMKKAKFKLTPALQNIGHMLYNLIMFCPPEPPSSSSSAVSVSRFDDAGGDATPIPAVSCMTMVLACVKQLDTDLTSALRGYQLPYERMESAQREAAGTAIRRASLAKSHKQDLMAVGRDVRTLQGKLKKQALQEKTLMDRVRESSEREMRTAKESRETQARMRLGHAAARKAHAERSVASDLRSRRAEIASRKREEEAQEKAAREQAETERREQALRERLRTVSERAEEASASATSATRRLTESRRSNKKGKQKLQRELEELEEKKREADAEKSEAEAEKSELKEEIRRLQAAAAASKAKNKEKKARQVANRKSDGHPQAERAKRTGELKSFVMFSVVLAVVSMIVLYFCQAGASYAHNNRFDGQITKKNFTRQIVGLLGNVTEKYYLLNESPLMTAYVTPRPQVMSPSAKSSSGRTPSDGKSKQMVVYDNGTPFQKSFAPMPPRPPPAIAFKDIQKLVTLRLQLPCVPKGSYEAAQYLDMTRKAGVNPSTLADALAAHPDHPDHLRRGTDTRITIDIGRGKMVSVRPPTATMKFNDILVPVLFGVLGSYKMSYRPVRNIR